MFRYLAAVALVLMVGAAHADDDEEDCRPDNQAKADQGWFFYEHCPPKKKPIPEKKPEPQAAVPAPEAKPEAKQPMTVAWMRKMLPILHERAVDNPTKENVQAYAYMVRTMGDKAQRYSDVYASLIKTDPFLDMNNEIPFNSSHRNEILSKASADKREALGLVAKKAAGLFVFFDSKCSFCKSQIQVVNSFAKANKFDVMYVSVDGKGLPGATGWVKDNGTAKSLGIKIFPTTVLAIPPKMYIPISFGLMAEDQLQTTILAAAEAADIIPTSLVKDMDPFARGVLTSPDMQDGAYDDPAKFVEYVKKKLEDRY